MTTSASPVEDRAAARAATLGLVHRLIEALDRRRVRYCHWKSNVLLAEALSGATDIDLLVDRRDADAFEAAAAELAFRPARMAHASYPAMAHYFALDPETGTLVHLHAYYRVITGESLAKNLRLPLEDMLLSETRRVHGVPIPAPAAELVVFTVRMMLKHTSLVELWLLSREGDRTRREMEWLKPDTSLAGALALVRQWLPTLDLLTFARAVEMLRRGAPLDRRIALARRMRAQLGSYARGSTLGATLTGLRTALGLARRRLQPSHRGMVPSRGGAVVAFVGPEATGKSTLIAATERWLGEHFAVSRVHAGKPPSTWLTLLPNTAVPALRSLLPGTRSGSVEARYQQPQARPRVYPLMFAVRAVLLAHDRRVLLTRAFARAANGAVVLCDRYPSQEPGAADSPQLARLPLPAGRYPVRRWLARCEAALYRAIPPADLVVSLHVPLEVALVRNRERGKHEPEAYVRRRHARASSADFGPARVAAVHTDQPLDITIREVQRVVWDAL